MELVRSDFEHKESTHEDYRNLQYAELSMLELYYNISRRNCSSDNYEEMEVDTGSLYQKLAQSLYTCIR